MHREASRDENARGERELLSFIRRARRRNRIVGLLAGSAAAAVLNEACRWGSIGVNIWAKARVLPVLDVGPFFLAALLFVLRGRWRLPAVALRTDARLGLRDRLASFLDFRERDDVPADLRRAQAEESAAALAGVAIGVAAPIRPWLAAGPALLAISLLYPLFLAGAPETPVVRLVRRIAPVMTARNDAPGGGQSADSPDSQPRPDGPAKRRIDGKHAGDPSERDTPRDAHRGLEPETEPGRKLVDGSTAKEMPGDRKPPAQVPQQDGPLKEPEQIDSERVGTSLAKVVDPLFNPGTGAATPAPAPSGSFSYRLLPKAERDGAGGASRAVDTAYPERVTVDFDALPEQYRSLVRTYFELLARNAARTADNNPIPAERTR